MRRISSDTSQQFFELAYGTLTGFLPLAGVFSAVVLKSLTWAVLGVLAGGVLLVFGLIWKLQDNQRRKNRSIDHRFEQWW
jgi:hypothetical protein